MKAVNLIPSDNRRAGFNSGLRLGPAYAVLGVLAVAVGLMTLYVLTNNTISKRKSQIASVQTQIVQEHAQAAHLANYVRFAQLRRPAPRRSARSRRPVSTGTPPSPTSPRSFPATLRCRRSTAASLRRPPSAAAAALARRSAPT